MSSVYQPVYSRATGWVLGVIENHVARPLTQDEIAEAVKQLNEVSTLKKRLLEATDIIAKHAVPRLWAPRPDVTHAVEREEIEGDSYATQEEHGVTVVHPSGDAKSDIYFLTFRAARVLTSHLLRAIRLEDVLSLMDDSTKIGR